MRYNPNIKLRDIAGERMLVIGTSTSVDLTKVVLLNSTAEFLWNALKDKDFSIEDAADLLTETYSIDKKTALNDAGNWADSMVKAGLCI
ncbi:MAG: PqqD family protein [Bacteroidales bacterium]|nr:PqqD family protein [Bacteroidales bacterium]